MEGEKFALVLTVPNSCVSQSELPVDTTKQSDQMHALQTIAWAWFEQAYCNESEVQRRGYKQECFRNTG